LSPASAKYKETDFGNSNGEVVAISSRGTSGDFAVGGFRPWHGNGLTFEAQAL